MPRQSRRSGPSQQSRSAHTMSAPRPAAPPARSTPPPQQHAPAQPQHAMTPQTAAPPVVHQQAPQQPGLFAQMATTAAGVAVGSAAGHAITGAASSLFGGGSSSEPAPAPQEQQYQPQYQQAPPQQQYQAPQGAACEADAKAFTRCLEDNSSDITACQWYLDQLKACREMAKQY
ncbi:unnamed protein product [Cunninghamella blakesleeana]